MINIALAFLIITGLARAQSSGSIRPDGSIDAFEAAASWLEQWEAPDSYELPDGAVGAWVAIRWSGRLLAEADDMRAALASERTNQALPRAMRLALSRAEHAFSASGDPTEQADRAAQLRAAPTTLELQLAHAPERVRGVDLEEMFNEFRPGVDGLMITLGTKAHAVFPGEMLANNQSPRDALLGLLVEMNRGVKEFLDLLVAGQARVWRFEVDHLTQVERGDAPSFMYRGSRVVSEADVTTASLRGFADELAARLERRLWPGGDPLGALGTYRFDIDQTEPLLASAEEQGLIAFALYRYTRCPGIDPAQRDQAREAADRIIRDLSVVESEVESDPAARAESAVMVALALREAPDYLRSTAEVAELRKRSMATLHSAYSEETGYIDGLGPSVRAAIALAFGTRKAVDWAWQSTAAPLQPSLLPWIGWAEMELARNDASIPAGRALRALRSRTWEAQHDFSAGGEVEPDLRGGIKFRRTHAPDWSTARPLIFLAAMVRDPRLTPPSERGAEIVRLASGLRFLRQLSVREADRYRLPNPDEALGGVRSAVWSSTLPPAATAMTLLAVCEAIRSLDAIAQEQHESNASGDRR